MIHLDLSPPLLAIYVPLIGALLISLAGRCQSGAPWFTFL